jgi:hypothetical protein
MSIVDTIKDRMNNIRGRIPINKVEESVHDTRLGICSSCEFLFTPTNSCTKCGCFVRAKTWIPGAKCPLDKW